MTVIMNENECPISSFNFYLQHHLGIKYLAVHASVVEYHKKCNYLHIRKNQSMELSWYFWSSSGINRSNEWKWDCIYRKMYLYFVKYHTTSTPM